VIRTQLKVVKADGSVEEYLHTKVMGTINNALGETDQANIEVAEHFAEVVTYYLYHQQDQRTVTSNEIFSVIKAVLSSTGYEEAAVALAERHFRRKLRRSRIEVISTDIMELTDAEHFTGDLDTNGRSRWDKSRIVCDLTNTQKICRQTARLIASMVEEKVFNMGISQVPSSLVKQLVLGDTATVLRAQRELQIA
jgi:transcriptional regulator NrdR family protein